MEINEIHEEKKEPIITYDYLHDILKSEKENDVLVDFAYCNQEHIDILPETDGIYFWLIPRYTPEEWKSIYNVTNTKDQEAFLRKVEERVKVLIMESLEHDRYMTELSKELSDGRI